MKISSKHTKHVDKRKEVRNSINSSRRSFSESLSSHHSSLSSSEISRKGYDLANKKKERHTRSSFCNGRTSLSTGGSYNSSSKKKLYEKRNHYRKYSSDYSSDYSVDHYKHKSRKRSIPKERRISRSSRHQYREKSRHRSYRSESHSPASSSSSHSKKYRNRYKYDRPIYHSSKYYKHRSYSRSLPRFRRRTRRSHSRYSSSPFYLDSSLSGKRSNNVKSRRYWKFDSPPRPEVTDSQIETIGTGTGLVPSTASGPLNVNGVPGTISQLLCDDGPQQQSPLGLLAQSLGLSAEQQKAARELYVGNLPTELDVNQLIEFFNAAMKPLNDESFTGNSVLRAWIASDGHFGFIEFCTIEQATLGLQLNGLNCMGYSLRIGRPKTYPAEYASLLTTNSGNSSSNDTSYANSVNGSSQANLINPETAILAAQAAAAGIPLHRKVIERKPDRLVILNLPPLKEYSESEVKNFLASFGTLKVFQCFEVPRTNEVAATTVCIFEYIDYCQQKALEKGIVKNQIAEYPIIYLLAEDAIRQGKLSEVMKQAATAGINLQEELGGELMKPQVATRVLMLSNLVTRSELLDDKEYCDIIDDVHIECSHYGKVNSIIIPRPAHPLISVNSPGIQEDSAVGYAFIEFSKLQGAGAARKGLSGRKFSGRTVEASYFSEKRFQEKDFKDPQPNYETSGRLPDSV